MGPIEVWMIDEGNPGHRAQSEGVLDALRRSGLDLSTTRIPCTSKLRGFLRPVARILTGMPGSRWPLRVARQFTDFHVPGSPPPAFIISSGGRSAYLSRALACWTGRPNVYVGFPDPFPAHWFTIVMPTVDWPLRATSVIPTGITPSKVTPEKCRSAAAEYWRGNVPQNCWALLVGGSSTSHHFGRADWEAMVRGLHTLAQNFGIKWLISTSRRTGAVTDELIRSLVNPRWVEDSTFVSSDPKKVVMPYLGAAQIAFVTQDSRTMTAEALMSGRPVAIVTPTDVRMPADINLKALEYILSLSQVARVAAAAMKDYVVHADPHTTYPEPGERMNRGVAQLRERLAL